MRSTNDFKKYNKNIVRILLTIIFQYIQNKKEKSYDNADFGFINGPNYAQYMNMNNNYFVSNDDYYLEESPYSLHSKRISAHISNDNYGQHNYNTNTNKINRDKIVLNDLGISNNNLNNFKNINYIYDDNYQHKYFNTNTKPDYSRKGIIRDGNNNHRNCKRTKNYKERNQA